MENDGSNHLCPFCNRLARVTMKRFNSISGKEYGYMIFHHKGELHKFPLYRPDLRRFHKGLARRKLLELLNSTHFEQAIFSVGDVVKALKESANGFEYAQVSRMLHEFAESGLISTLRKGRVVNFINTPSTAKLNFVIKGVAIDLLADKDSKIITFHKIKVMILNNNQYALSYFPYRILGDNKRTRDEVSFRAYEIPSRKRVKVYYLEDNPLEKRIIIPFKNQIPPGQEKKLMIEYCWPEIEPSYTFTASTELKKLSFSVSSARNVSLLVTSTNSSQTESNDVSAMVIQKSREDGLNTAQYEERNVPPFVYHKFKWNISEEKRVSD